MDPKTVLSHVDHTLLRADAISADIQRLCEEALFYSTASVCIHPRFVPLAASLLKNKLSVCTVVGFPLGATTTESKVFEAADAIDKGAAEIDMVVSIGDIKEKRYSAVECEIGTVRQAIGRRILKVIIETCLLTDEEKAAMCHVVEAAGADYIKTSTGFSTGGATFSDVALLARETGGRIKIKASGGISSFEDMVRYLELGADRLGSSSAVRIVRALSR